MDALNQPATYRNMMATTPHKKKNGQRNPWTRRPKLITGLPLIAWKDACTGKNVGEADIPGHGRRGPKGRNQRAIARQTKKEHIWLRSHDVGSIRAKDRRDEALDADIDVFAFQETSADIKTIHDAKLNLAKSNSEPYGANQWKYTNRARGHWSLPPPPYIARNSPTTHSRLKGKNSWIQPG